MQFFSRKPRPATPAGTVADAPRTIAGESLGAVAGGLNPQPLPPYHEPERI
jgi:hypothetical protein